MKKLTLMTILLTSALNLFSQNKDYYSADMTKKFGDNLYSNGFFEEAAGEYMRYMFMTAEPDFTAFDNLTDIFRKTKNYEKLDWLNNYQSLYSHELIEKYNFVHAESLFIRNQKLLLKDKTFYLDKNKFIVTLSSEILSFNYKSCIELINTFFKEDSSPLEFTALKNEMTNYSPKSPLLALCLSAVVPGSGKWYGDSFRSGFNSFLAIGLSGAGTFWCYQEYGAENWRTLALGSATIVSYIVELYGSYQNANRVNNAKQRKIHDAMLKIYEAEY